MSPLRALPLVLWRCCSAAPPRSRRGRGPRPDILLITLDTLRADHLGAYGAPPDATPALDALAARGVVFERMLAASSRTAPSHASLFTSRWVRDHGIGFRNGSTRLGDEPTLASRLARGRLQTAAFVSNSMLRRRIGLDAGFDHYDDALPDHETNRPVFERVAEKTTARATRWLRETRETPRPRFLWVHYNDPHGPYTPPARYVKEPSGEPETTLPVLQIQRGFHGIPAYQALDGQDDPRQYLARYAGEIRYLDDSIGALVESFGRGPEGSGAIIAITADHGESLGEEDMWFSHGFATTPNLAHVPFLLLADGLPAGRVSTPVHHVDVLPTLLELAGIPVPEDAAGRGARAGPARRGAAGGGSPAVRGRGRGGLGVPGRHVPARALRRRPGQRRRGQLRHLSLGRRRVLAGRGRTRRRWPCWRWPTTAIGLRCTTRTRPMPTTSAACARWATCRRCRSRCRSPSRRRSRRRRTDHARSHRRERQGTLLAFAMPRRRRLVHGPRLPRLRRRQPLLRGAGRLHAPPATRAAAALRAVGRDRRAHATTWSADASSRAVANPTFEPDRQARRALRLLPRQPEGKNPIELLRDREPIPAEYRDRDARVAGHRAPGPRGGLALPHPRHALRGAAEARHRGGVATFRAFNRWLEEDWGFDYQRPHLRRALPHAGATWTAPARARVGARARRARAW